jgi:polyisoprenoid-binding protein YceI
MRTIALLALIISFPLAVLGQTAWKQTSASVNFTIKNRGSDVPGHFERVATTLIFSPDKLGSSSLKGTAEVSSIKTGIDQRDQDLQGDKYFDAAQHKDIELVSTSLTQKGSHYTGMFNLTIKGVTKPVEIPFEFTESGNTAEFKGSFTINRRDYGVGKKALGLSMFLADDVHVTIDIKATK